MYVYGGVTLLTSNNALLYFDIPTNKWVHVKGGNNPGTYSYGTKASFLYFCFFFL
jgi:hypothetical protein